MFFLMCFEDTSKTSTPTSEQPTVTPSTTCPEVQESMKAAPVDPADWSAMSDMVRTELVSRGPCQVYISKDGGWETLPSSPLLPYTSQWGKHPEKLAALFTEKHQSFLLLLRTFLTKHINLSVVDLMIGKTVVRYSIIIIYYIIL